ncbi:MAG: response regulator transcription factor [Acidobacteria bacterium]|nr:response regulator transcription factor [Acidobacteriota bacterium]
MDGRLLLVEDEPGLVATLQDRLTAAGYRVESVGDARSGFERAVAGKYDLVLLDVMLPGGSGFEVCRAVRRHGVSTPILMLTARGSVTDRVTGLKLGADDYLVKPFQMAELLARIEALLRRHNSATEVGVVECGDLMIDLKRGEVTKTGRIVELSTREFDLIRYFGEHRGHVLSRERLLKYVWGYTEIQSTRTVDVHVAWLRQKLEDNPRRPKYILTVHGFGYRLACPQ